jgi:CBS domain-containing protein
MSIRDFCRSELGYLFEHETVADASIKMRNLHLGALVVVEQHGARLVPVGMLTDRDIVVRGVARHPGTCGSLSVREVMSREVLVTDEEAALESVLATMRSRGIRRMPIVDLSGSLVAMFEFDDFIGLVSRELADVAKLVIRERRVERRANA